MLELLPAELHLEVFSHLQNGDLKAVRAVSRRLRDNASPALFHSIVACARYEALGAFQNISVHSVLQNYVKEIVFDGSVYHADLANSSERYIKQNNELGSLSASSSFWSVRTRWKRYKDLYTEQEDLKASGVLLQTIARALECTQNVSAIVYSPCAHLIPVEAKVVHDLVPRDFRIHYRPSTHIPQGRFFAWSDHPFRQLIGAIYTAQYTGVRELRVEAFDESDRGTPFTFDFLDCPNVHDLQAGQYLFQHLEKCALNVKVWPSQDTSIIWSLGDNGTNRFAHLSTLLAAANDLRYLVIRITVWQWNDSHAPSSGLRHDQAMFSRLGLLKTWSKLQSLCLEGIDANEEDFLDIMSRHKNSLSTLVLRNCSLCVGIWANIVDEVVYSTGIFPFVLSRVNEVQIPAGIGVTQSSEGLEEWKYEGRVEVLDDGERKFVDIVSTKKSVYYRTM